LSIILEIIMEINIEKYLIELMHQHDCVVIPGLGGLVANFKPAFSDADNTIFSPASKGFIFNRFLHHNDGLLAHKISELAQIPYDSALAKMEQYVSEIKESLKNDGRFSWETIGSLYQDEKGAIRLDTKDKNYLLSSFGLPIVKAMALPALEKEVPIKQLIPEVKVEEIKVSTKSNGKVIAIDQPIQFSNRKVSNGYIWVAAVAVIGFYSAWIPMKTDLLKNNGEFQYADLNPFSFEKASHKSAYASVSSFELIDTVAPANMDVFADIQNNYQADYLTQEYVAEAETTFVDIKKPETTFAEVTSKTYFVIGGCFSKKENALNFVSELKTQGFDAQLVDVNNGLHRVSLGKYTSRKDAKSLKTQISSEGEYSTWILKKG